METQFTDKLENLLRIKSYSYLNEEEKLYVLSIISEEEYDLFSQALLEVSNRSEIEANELSVSDDVLPNLQRTFQEKHQPFYLKPIKLPFGGLQIQSYQAYAALLIFALVLFSLITSNEKDLVSDESHYYYLSEAEFNKYTQWDGFYLEMSEVTIEDDVTQELMNMKF